MSEDRRNWAGNYRYRASHVHRPTTLAQVQELVASNRKVRALGSRHSFNAIADSPGDQISLSSSAHDSDRPRSPHGDGHRRGPVWRTLPAAPPRRICAAQSGLVAAYLGRRGACATATHGSGDRNGNLATAVAALELVTADGELVPVARAGRRRRSWARSSGSAGSGWSPG